MATLLLRNAACVVTMDADRREIADGFVLIEDNRVVAVGGSDALPEGADTVIDLSGHVLMPGLVNTHHHMFQSLTRAVPAAQDADLFGWLRALYPIWARLTPEMVRISTQVAMAELMLSGCTTSSDHLYLYPNGCRLDDSIEAADEIGLRFHAARGAMSLGESAGGLPPDALVEDEAAILADSRRLIETWHDPARYAMRRIVVAPCSPFSVSEGLMRDAAALARSYGVSLHTHLAENQDDVTYSRDRFGKTPADYAADLGWVGPDVWHAHCVKLDEDGIRLFARTGTGVAHCPCSNMRLASGIAPVPRMRCEGVPVGLGVDGSASNDAGHLLGEARQAMLLARVGFGPAAMTARQALEIATLGGAKVLGRDDIGSLAPGMAADCVAFDLRGLSTAGALHDPVAALVFCAPPGVALSVINGRIVVREGRLLTVDARVLAERHNALSRRLVNGD
ncbi:8-oxoguanine deaminase [Methylobacterium indicum]|uniref:8-oxoguanine deaminase n=1 Tax=Methylobacterium indicum TaxID=1775910 RepID=UPI002435215C|nr:8-oxoguanine deaminase [Methylobacterium indicum]